MANIFDHIQDHCRWGLENKFLENKLFITSEVKLLFIIQTSDKMPYFPIFQDKLRSVNIQDDQSSALSETVQKISRITHTASRFSFL